MWCARHWPAQGGGFDGVDGRRHVVNMPTEEVFTSPDRRRTEGTVRSMSYSLELAKLAPGLGLIQKACPLLVPMVESAAILPSLWKSNVAYIQGYYVRSPSDKMDFNF